MELKKVYISDKSKESNIFLQIILPAVIVTVLITCIAILIPIDNETLSNATILLSILMVIIIIFFIGIKLSRKTSILNSVIVEDTQNNIYFLENNPYLNTNGTYDQKAAEFYSGNKNFTDFEFIKSVLTDNEYALQNGVDVKKIIRVIDCIKNKKAIILSADILVVRNNKKMKNKKLEIPNSFNDFDELCNIINDKVDGN